jgi:hypothetical protein
MMSRCKNIQRELQAFVDNELDESRRSEVSEHLKDCRDCSKTLRELMKLPEVLQSWQAPEPSPLLFEKLLERVNTRESLCSRTLGTPLIKRITFHLVEVAAVVALTLSLNHWFGRPAPQIHDNTATLNLYLKEHQDIAARTVSFEPPAPPSTSIDVHRHDILYYEFLDDPYEFTRPGIIVRGPLPDRQTVSSAAPAIANGHTMTLSQARDAAGFELVSPPRLHPGYMLDQVRRIDGRDALHLLYTDGINTLSLFEQSLDGARGLAPEDFREYAIYRSEGQGGGTILAWRDDALSYVLISKVDMAQIMDMAQSISAAK